MLNSISGLFYAGVLGGVLYLGLTYGIYEKSYVSDLEKQVEMLTVDNNTLKANQQKLVAANESNQQTIQRIQQQQQSQDLQMQELMRRAAANQAQVNGYIRMFQEKNFPAFVGAKPQWLENMINSGTDRALEDVYTATSRTLESQETQPHED